MKLIGKHFIFFFFITEIYIFHIFENSFIYAETNQENINIIEARKLTLSSFVKDVIQNDPSFPLILSEELNLKYQKDLNLPASDLILDVAAQYDLFLPIEESSKDTPWEGSIGLSKLFSSTGTTISAEYSNSLYNTYSGANHRSSLGIKISQSIAQNAFGILTRMQKEKIHIDNQIVRFQIIESYEEYMASLIQIYLDWYSLIETIKVNENSLRYTKDLLNAVARKQKYRIAYPEDVYKMESEWIQERENLLELRANLNVLENNIYRLIGVNNSTPIVPSKPDFSAFLDYNFLNKDEFKMTRTYQILKDNEKSALIAKNIAERSLYPEVNFFTGYSARGEDYNIKNPTHNMYFGLETTMNFTQQQEKAERNIMQNQIKIARLNRQKDMFDLKIYLQKLNLEINMQKEKMELAQKRISLLEKVLNAERKNYNIGKKTLDDLITAKKNLDEARHDIINYEMTYQSLILEWTKTTDSLINRKKKVNIINNDK